MATLTFLLLVAVVSVNAVPKTPIKNTIFADEKIEGQIFENVDAFNDIATLDTVPSDYRLPKTTRPVHYDINWQIDINRLYFSGSTTIHLVASQINVTEIVIHCHDLTLMSVVLRLGTTVIPTTYLAEPDFHFLRIRLTTGALQYDPINEIIYTLAIEFGAPLRTDMYGIYRSWYRNDPTATTVSWMASTQFQATAARFAFPCYDEPSFKATFDIVITRPTAFRSWSCTRQTLTRDSTIVGYQEDVYARTPIMSTYLLALIVAEYNNRTVNNPDGSLKYEVIARPGAIAENQEEYSFIMGQELTDVMSLHTGIDYYSVSANLKMTHASIPDFSAGAMENWGLITYREAYLMYDPNHTSDYFKQLIAYILSHEIAHMWFGNLVTNEYWDCLWLNEGFARYYQYFLTDWVDPSMGLETRFITEQMHTSLLSDSANNPHPLTNPNVGSPASVSAMFSTLSYNKGAAVIRMTEHLLGFEVHRLGLQNYLRENYLGTAVPNDLFQALQTVAVSSGAIAAYGSNFSVVDYYRSWTEQGGHPVLYVAVNHQTGDMTIQQRRFNINTGYSTDNSQWIIPITFASASNNNFNNTKPSHVIDQSITVINRGSVGDEWVVFNKQQTGFYRVNYDDYTWDLIILALRGNNRTQIHEYNRAQIVDDVFQFARSGIMSYNRAFNILSFLENETEYAPWVAAITGFNWLRNRFAGTPLITQFETLIARWATPIMNQLTYLPIANETFMRSYLRWQLAPLMCGINVRACRDSANTQFRALFDTNTEVPINSRNWVYCNGVREGSEADFDNLWLRYQRHNVYTEKIQILQFIGCVAHASRVNSHLTNIVQENQLIRPQDYSAAFNSVLTGREANTQLVFTFIQNNLAAVINAFGSAATPLSNVASRLRTIDEVNAFLAWTNANQNLLGTAYTTIVNNAELTRQSILWTSQIRNDAENYFNNGDDNINVSTPAPAPPTNPTVAPPELVQPETPDIPDSAVTAFLSFFAITLAAVANLAL